MEEKKNGVNVSSGAKKVEAIKEATQAKTPAKSKSATKRKSSGVKKTASAKKSQAPQKSQKSAAEKREEQAAQKRVAIAKAKAERKEKKLLARAELKQKQLEKRAAIKEKRLERKAKLNEQRAARKERALEQRAQMKAKKAERKAEKIARRETLKHESATQKKRRLEREKKERIALKRQRRERAEQERANRRKAREEAQKRRAQEKRSRREKRERSGGYGGWLAAVISLGVACLALATVVTAGAFRMNDMNTAATNGFRTTLFEMVSASEDMDGNLSKLRVSEGVNEQRTLLTNVLVDTALLESAVERCPVDEATATDISAFINKTSSYARAMLKRLATGKSLTAREHATLAYLYEVNATLHRELNELAMNTEGNQLMSFLMGEENSLGEKFAQMGAGMKIEPKTEVDEPFSGVGNVGENQLSRLEEVSSARAGELAREYLSGYHVKEVVFLGETLASDIECYNFSLVKEDGKEIFAQITKRGGKLAFFDSYELCTTKNFDLETCDSLAREFLEKMGVKGVEAVWLSDAGVVADLTYVAVVDGVRAYPDLVRVRVCEEKGLVVGMDASDYLCNHQARDLSAGISRAKAQAKLSPAVEVEHSALALVPVEGEEILAYEFECAFGAEKFVIYLDANTGEEVAVYTVRETAQGRYLR